MYYCHPNIPIGVDFHCGRTYYRISPRIIALALDLIAKQLEGGEAGSRFPELQSLFYREHYSSRASRRLRLELGQIAPKDDWPAPAVHVIEILRALADKSAASGQWILMFHPG